MVTDSPVTESTVTEITVTESTVTESTVTESKATESTATEESNLMSHPNGDPPTPGPTPLDFIDPAEFLAAQDVQNLNENAAPSNTNLETLFKESEKDEEIDVAPDVGAPVTETQDWGIKEKAFEDLVVDEEKKEIK